MSIDALEQDRELNATILDKTMSPIPPLRDYVQDLLSHLDMAESEIMLALEKGESYCSGTERLIHQLCFPIALCE